MQIDFMQEIGVPAYMELLAEEASELAQASLKFARKIRGENPTPRRSDEIYDNLAEEIADVLILVDNLAEKDPEFKKVIIDFMLYKRRRFADRLKRRQK